MANIVYFNCFNEILISGFREGTQLCAGDALQVAGLTYTYDPAKEAGNKVVSVVLDDGTELSRDDAETEILMAANSYVSGFDAFAEGDKSPETYDG